MSSIPSRFTRPKLAAQPLQAEPGKSIYVGRHATVHCHECNRTMVPRVIINHGQPLKSICPFCGATFLKFQSGFQRFMARFDARTLSFVAVKQLLIVTLGFILFGYISDWVKLPFNIGLMAFLGAAIFGVTCAAELLFQCIEQLAAKFSHESNYYWATIVAVAMMTACVRNDLIGYIAGFFLIILLRGFIVGIIQLRINPR
jgi:hypothetical protein